MQILTGTKREITLMQWNEQLEKQKYLKKVKSAMSFIKMKTVSSGLKKIRKS